MPNGDDKATLTSSSLMLLPFFRGMQTLANMVGNEETDAQANSQREETLESQQQILDQIENPPAAQRLTAETRQQIDEMLTTAFGLGSNLGEALAITLGRFVDNDELTFSILRLIEENSRRAEKFIADALRRVADPSAPEPDFLEVSVPDLPLDAPIDAIQAQPGGPEVAKAIQDLQVVDSVATLQSTAVDAVPSDPAQQDPEVVSQLTESLESTSGDLEDVERQITDQKENLQVMSKDLQNVLDISTKLVDEKIKDAQERLVQKTEPEEPPARDPNDVINSVEDAFFATLGVVAIFGDTSDSEGVVASNLEDVSELVSDQLLEGSRTRAEGAVETLTGLIGVGGTTLGKFVEENIDNPPELEKMLRRIQDQLNVVRSEFGIPRVGGGAPGQFPLRTVRAVVRPPPERVAVERLVDQRVTEVFPNFVFDTSVQQINSTFVVTVNFTPDTEDSKDVINEELQTIANQVGETLGVDVRLQSSFTKEPVLPSNPPSQEQIEELERLIRDGSFVVTQDGSPVLIEELDALIESGEIDADVADQLITNGNIAQEVELKRVEGLTVPTLEQLPEGIITPLLAELQDSFRKATFEVSVEAPGCPGDGAPPEIPVVT